ncbi:MAG: hypothetical protein QM768_15970 [Agriterribacter sp.]
MESEKEKLKREFDGYFDEIIKKARKSFSLAPPKRRFTDIAYLKHFMLFKDLKKPRIDQIWWINDKNFPFYIISIEADSTLTIGSRTMWRETQTHRFLFGLVISDNNLGNSIIMRETFAHKVSEVFQKVEIDFKSHSKFSSYYYCLSKNEEHFRSVMSDDVLGFLSKVKNIDFEFNNQAYLFRPQKSIIDKKTASQMFIVGYTLAKLL